MNPSMVTFRRPHVTDGTAIWRLAAETKKLDTNSVYAYLMMCDMFAETCAIASHDERVIGFATAFRKPGQPDTLFVWQVGVRPDLQGAGIGTRLIRHLLERKELSGIRYLEGTVGPGNDSSRRLFLRFAEGRGTQCRIAEHYREALFPVETEHETELLFRVGPLAAARPAPRNPSDKEVVN
ncbi:diaminobutyrate acetyltransferase [Paenibacillus lycopersici]|uniref:L-2,4-diaminobutyric acid acetyltransferase n=1 Tax=Paenibacillus lycopersici TaxID=2704462 RepID=A0A6C0G356_9BACL|nr:diaminobutyrate acetyltransferase [Paenibacillus lycopersici]QHT61060.1 diaminobutyrate acetyltransferase [Paenibacillus lycopersici]